MNTTREKIIELGQRVKRVRRVLLLSQKDMAAALDISPGYLSEIESGKANPGPEFFLKFSGDYDVSVEYLFHGRGDMFYPRNRKIETAEDFHFDRDIESIEELVWLMEHSPFFKNMVLAYASITLLDNEDLIKKSVLKSQKAPAEIPAGLPDNNKS